MNINSQLPPGWEWKRLGDICQIKGGKRLPKMTGFSNTKTKHVYIRVTDFYNYSISTNKLKYIGDEVHEQIKNYIISKDDVYLSIAGTIGITGTIPQGLDGSNLTENAVRLIIDINIVCKEYLVQFLASSFGQEQIEARTNIVGQPKLAIERIKTISIALPPISEQHRIAAIIDTKLATIEKAKKAAEEQEKATNIIIQAYVNKNFDDGVYKKVKISDICKVNPSSRGKLKNLKEDTLITFIPMPAVSAELGQIIEPEIKPLFEVRKGFTYFEENDIIFAKITPCMQNGKHAIAKGLKNNIGFGSTEFHVIKPGPGVLPEWIYYFIRQHKYLGEAENFLQGAVGQQRLPDNFLRYTVIPLPSINEQKQKITDLEKRIETMQRIKNDINTSLALINAIPAAILRKTFKGEL
jgi:type I restriction enzyme S subunit